LNGHFDVMQILCDYGSNINLKQKNGATAIYLAASNGNLKIVEYLYQKGADIKIHEKGGWTPIMIGRVLFTIKMSYLIEIFILSKSFMESTFRNS
jgi:ankyrin repeat protein